MSPFWPKGPPGSLARIFHPSSSGLVLSQGCGVEVGQWESLWPPSPAHPPIPRWGWEQVMETQGGSLGDTRLPGLGGVCLAAHGCILPHG